MAPIRRGDGTGISSIRTGDGTGIAEVRKGDGTVLWSAEPAIPDSGVARWKFEQNVTDSWGDNDGSDNTSDGYSTNSAVGSYSKSLDGVDDYIDVSGEDYKNFSEFTITAWVYLAPSPNTPQAVYEVATDGPNGRIFIYYVGGGDGYRFTVGDGSNDINLFQGTDPATESWHHIGGVYVENDRIELYFDGSSVASDSITTHENSSTTEYIGSSPTFGNYWNGLLDDIRVYDKGLSATEMSNLYNTGSISG